VRVGLGRGPATGHWRTGGSNKGERRVGAWPLQAQASDMGAGDGHVVPHHLQVHLGRGATGRRYGDPGPARVVEVWVASVRGR